MLYLSQITYTLVTATEAVEPEAVKPAEGGEATGEEPIAEVHAPATDESGASPPTAEETPSQEPSAGKICQNASQCFSAFLNLTLTYFG